MSGQELIVIKHGSSAVGNENHIGLDQSSIDFHVQQHVRLRKAGFLTVEVASGAAIAGKEYLIEMGQDPDDEFTANEWAVYGTARQLRHWEEAARPHGIIVGQVLATHSEINDDMEPFSPGTFMAKMIHAMTWYKSLVVTNENDAIAVEELNEWLESQDEIGREKDDPESDNDWLAAHLAMALGASALLILGKMDGFKIEDQVVPTLKTADINDVLKYCDEPGILGTGGMASKLRAAARAANAGMKVTIGNAFTDYRRLLAGEVGTRVVK